MQYSEKPVLCNGVWPWNTLFFSTDFLIFCKNEIPIQYIVSTLLSVESNIKIVENLKKGKKKIKEKYEKVWKNVFLQNLFIVLED